METETLFWHRALVFGFGVLYWVGVSVQARRVRKRIGRSPNVKPRGTKEKLLWLGWAFVVLSWLGLPLLPRGGVDGAGWPGLLERVGPYNLWLGLCLMVAGYGGTLWCYISMGDAWRMGVMKNERTQLITRGPYGRVRHPIYLFQAIMVAAIFVLLPSWISLAVLVVHVVCIQIKARDEERHLRGKLGPDYEQYCATTGAWLPKLLR
jgi:protein-S-isoprenylcysteine O-methyltransferase Ste14